MMRKIACCFSLLMLSVSLPARSEVTYTEVTEGEPHAIEHVTVIRMTVTPAAEPVPALKHRFVARSIDLKPGNAAPYYYRAIMESSQLMQNLRDKFKEDEELSRWYGTGMNATSISELPLEKMRDANRLIDGHIDGNLTDAIIRRECDWELGIEEIRGVEIISFLLPEFQKSRELARMVSLRTRLAIAERRYGEAIDSMRMNYRLGRDVAKPPLIVCGLIGIAIQEITNGTLIELIAAPDSPNLYWPLSALPDPLVDMQPATRFELDFGPRMLPFIHHAETSKRASEEWNRLFTQAIRDLRHVSDPSDLIDLAPVVDNDVAAGLTATAAGLLGYSHAKAQLVAQGMDREQLDKMAVGQVMAIYTERSYQRYADEYAKLSHMPFWEMRKRSSQLEHELQAAGLLSGSENREVLPLVETMMPAMQAARSAEVRLERDIAALRVIESLRLHAAEHDGRLPASLGDIVKVPVPANPATGKPFAYRLEGTTAILELPSSDGIPGFNRRFEIQIAAKNS
jgi:hypothetical protein